MKKLLFLLLFAFACSATFGQMVRTVPVSNILQYAPSGKAQSVVIIMPGIGEKGSDLTVIEKNIGIAKALKAGTFTVNRIILFVQLAANQGGYYTNTVAPAIEYAQKFNLPIDLSGLSLGGMAVSNNLPYYPFIRSAMTCPGKVEANVTAGVTWAAIDYTGSYRKIPSIHYYDPADKAIDNGYLSIKSLVAGLQSEGKKDITLIELPGSGHNVWDFAYSLQNYWAWLDILDGPIVIVPKSPTIWINGKDTGLPGPITNIEVK